MSIYEEIQGWLAQIRSEVRALQVLLDNEQDEIETVHLVAENSLEINGSLQMTGIFQAAETVSVGDFSLLVEKIGRHLKENPNSISSNFRSQVKGDTGDRGPQGATGDKGPTGATGDQGPQGARGSKGDIGDPGGNRVVGRHDFNRFGYCKRCGESEYPRCRDCGERAHSGLCN